jgi:predicted DNA-binding helix-hairpin-helix protein
MIVGADSANDSDIVGKASTLYDRYGLRRVYYSAFSPIPTPARCFRSSARR